VISKQREYQKKKKQKKLQRYKQMEEEREGEKNKWLAFNSKVCEFEAQSSQSTAWARVICAD
jgi:survival-of-motor-neuron-related-splicing factor 30